MRESLTERAFTAHRGIDFSVNADSIKTSDGKHAWYYHGLEKLRDTLSASLLEVTDETTAGVLSSMAAWRQVVSG